MRQRFYFKLVLCLLAAGLVPIARAQSVATTSCNNFRDAKDPAQQALFMAYLQGYANASSPDPRYTQSDAALADDAKKVRDWCGDNKQKTYGEAVSAVLGPATNRAGGPAAAYAEPTSCRVGPTNYCAGCSITCTNGKQAACKPGTDNAFGGKSCTFQSNCACK